MTRLQISTVIEFNQNFQQTIEKARMELICAMRKSSYDEFSVRFMLYQNNEVITLILNNSKNEQGKFSANLYIKEVLGINNEKLYCLKNSEGDYIRYSAENLPSFSVKKLKAQDIEQGLKSKFYTNDVKPMVIKLAMLVEAIRFFNISDEIDRNLNPEVYGENYLESVNFQDFYSLIKNWERISDRYISIVGQCLEQSKNSISRCFVPQIGNDVQNDWDSVAVLQATAQAGLGDVVGGGKVQAGEKQKVKHVQRKSHANYL